MSVYDDLAQILSARYGKDVRQSIHDAIQQCYSDATGNPESVAAFADDIIEIKSTITAMQATINGQFNKFFPIGSLYVTGDDTFNPNTAEGWQGTWAKIKGRFILGSSDDYEVNSVGGEATHTLTVDEMPAHNHTMNQSKESETGYIPRGGDAASIGIHTDSDNAMNIGGTFTDRSGNSTTSAVINSTGGGEAFDIMPPYEVKHIWERTA